MSPKYGQKVLKLLLQLLLLLMQLLLSGWLAAAAIELGRSVGWSHAMRLAPGQVAQSTRSRKCPAVGAAKVRQGEARRGKAGVLSHLVDKTG